MSIIPPTWSLPVNTVIIIGASVTGGAVFFLVSWTCLCLQLNRREKRRRASAAAAAAARFNGLSASPSDDKSFSSGRETPSRPLIPGARADGLGRTPSGKKVAPKDSTAVDIPDDKLEEGRGDDPRKPSDGAAPTVPGGSVSSIGTPLSSVSVASSERTEKPKDEPKKEDNVADWERDLQATLFRKVPLSEVLSVTKNFDSDHVLGEGAFAVVYRGNLTPANSKRMGADSTGHSGGVQWAIKRSKRHLVEGSPGAIGFEREVLTLSRLAHRNLVRLLGYCIAEREHILIYELAENGSLGHALKTSKPPLSFSRRVNIALGAAEGLHYLHAAALPPVVHRDVKPDNILLDRDMAAKVADFGLLRDLMEAGDEIVDGAMSSARLDLPQSRQKQHQSVYTRVAGTPGYLDPEYHLTSKVTVKGDVYSFGVVLLELFTGRRVVLQNAQEARGARSSRGSKPAERADNAQGGKTSSPESRVMPSVAGGSSSSLWADSTTDLLPPPATGGATAAMKRLQEAAEAATSAAGMAASAAAAAAAAGEDEGSYPMHITQWAEPLVKARAAQALVDPRMADDYDPELLLAVLSIALRCMAMPSRHRPAMGAVVRALADVRERLAAPDGEVGPSGEIGAEGNGRGMGMGLGRSGLGEGPLDVMRTLGSRGEGSGGGSKGGKEGSSGASGVSGSVQEQLRMWVQLVGEESTSQVLKPGAAGSGGNKVEEKGQSAGDMAVQ